MALREKKTEHFGLMFSFVTIVYFKFLICSSTISLHCCTWRAGHWFKNSVTQGFSLTHPHWCCLPKKFSSRSWQIRLLRKPGMVNRYRRSSTKADTKIVMSSLILISTHQWGGDPWRVSLLSSIMFLSLLVYSPGLLDSHLTKNSINSSCSH